MPGRDGTGPGGFGALTGGGFGRCAGRGRGAGGQGWRHRFFETGLPGWIRFGEKKALENQAETLRTELDSIRKRLEDIEGADEAK